MAQTTVTQFAGELKLPVDMLLEQLQAAGGTKLSATDTLTEEDKSRLLNYLRGMHGGGGAKTNITLKRRETTEIKQADSSGRARTIQVEVRKKRVIVAPDVSPAAAVAPVAAPEPEEIVAPVIEEVAPVVEVVAEPEPVVIPEPVVEVAPEPEPEPAPAPVVVEEPVVAAAPATCSVVPALARPRSPLQRPLQHAFQFLMMQSVVSVKKKRVAKPLCVRIKKLKCALSKSVNKLAVLVKKRLPLLRPWWLLQRRLLPQLKHPWPITSQKLNLLLKPSVPK